jgi:CGNR zinc finger/Putative stress-induced transcription regulator
LLYEFLNPADQRSYFEKRKRHVPSDELETPAGLEGWMRERDLLATGGRISTADRRRALELCSALRSFVQLPPNSRGSARQRAGCLNRVTEFYPLVVKVGPMGKLRLRPLPGACGLGNVLAELLALTDNGRLDNLKMCSSDECHWVFLDRSKPGNRRWCSSLLCGNRQKMRDYRRRGKNSSN